MLDSECRDCELYTSEHPFKSGYCEIMGDIRDIEKCPLEEEYEQEITNE